MNIPNLPMGPLTRQDGHATSEYWGVLSQLITELQQNVSNEGYKIPQLPTATIAKLDNEKSKGVLVYDSDTNQLKININGTFKVIQTL